ncbi:MAG: hypothetical protein CMN31_09390, partial [Sandaracinus sp.]|nr:hypothetical protein [Sandaracinus sp.]
RPERPSAASLEQRLAVADILAKAGSKSAPTQLDGLTIEARIGGGAMGVVYRAHDPTLGRTVAVKLLRGALERARRELIVAEARALAQLSHPNVVTVHAIVDRDDELYFVMEHVPGVTLRRWLDARPSASWREVLACFLQAGRGLDAAHAAGLVHRDFKPENVLVGDDGRVRVVDFGLARALVADDPGAVVGSPHYMAPEVRAGQPATPASDQYGFARALADALAGRGAPPSLAAALGRALDEDPGARFATMEALLGELAGARRGPARSTRALLAERVERLWLEGVLERALDGSMLAEIPLEAAPELVDAPWEAWGSRPEGARERWRSTELGQVLWDAHESLLLVGPPGSGKTTLLLQLCRELLAAAERDADAPTPVVLSLSTYHAPDPSAAQPGRHLARWLGDELVAKYGLPRPSVVRWLEEGALALLLDGLDESEPGHRGAMVRALNDFREEHAVPVVVACREEEYEAAGERLHFGGALRILPLEDDAQGALLEALGAGPVRARVEAEPALRELLRNPLLLTLRARHGGGGVARGEVSGGDASADASSAESVSGTGWREVWAPFVESALGDVAPARRGPLLGRLSYLARAMRRRSVSDLWLERLDFGWLERGTDRVAGYLVGALLVLAVGVGLNTATTLAGNPLPSALTFGFAVTLGSFAYTLGRIKPVERLRWSWRRALKLLPLTMACAAAVGLAEGLQFNLWKNLVGAGLTALVLTLAFALDASPLPSRIAPNQGMRRSLHYAFGVSIGVGVPVGLLFAFVFEPYLLAPLREVAEHDGDPRVVVGFAVGLFVLTALFLIYGGFAVIMYGVLRLWLALRTPLPLRLQDTLDEAVAVGFMRRVGGGYVFLHRTLLDHFASEADREDAGRGEAAPGGAPRAEG